MPYLIPSSILSRVYIEYSSLLKKGVDDDGQEYNDIVTNERWLKLLRYA
jgi:hypothetical protein